MESVLPSSNTDLSAENKEDEEVNISKELDAGALFVLKSRGSWLHCGYHLTTSIVAPALLSLPYALSLMGWFAGALCLTISALVTFYSYNLLSLVLEHHDQLGMRQLRFRDMARDILGPGWGRYFVGPIQFGLCYGAVIACILLGGQSLKYIYLLSSSRPEAMQLYQFVIIFGVLMLVLAQIPSFHSLRHINLVSLILCLAYSICATAGSIYIGNSTNAPRKDYSLNGSGQNRVFGSFNAISIIATTYGNGIIPEIQATIAPPVKGKMFKGLCVCYAVVLSTFFSVGISGYWAFGNQAKGTILLNFLVDGKPLLPTWVLLMTNVFTFLQVSAVSVVYLQPTNEVLERKFANAKVDQFSVRNVVPRLVYRSLSVVIATTVAAMFPFFGDINALIGAFGCIPLDFILPMVFYNVVFKPSKYSLLFWGNTIIASTFSALGLLGAISSIRQIVLDSNTCIHESIGEGNFLKDYTQVGSSQHPLFNLMGSVEMSMISFLISWLSLGKKSTIPFLISWLNLGLRKAKLRYATKTKIDTCKKNAELSWESSDDESDLSAYVDKDISDGIEHLKSSNYFKEEVGDNLHADYPGRSLQSQSNII